MMGLFDFVKDYGKSLFSSEADAAGKIKAEIEAQNPGVENLEVAFDKGVVALSGAAKSAEAKEKTVLLAGNVKDVVKVEADALSAPEQAEKVEYYVIEKGDSLSKIAKTYYGNAKDYPKIFEANREVIKDADLIYPGQKIRIPL